LISRSVCFAEPLTFVKVFSFATRKIQKLSLAITSE
jgi:hypothetical protein